MSDKTIAICFYGLTRSLKYTIDSINTNIFEFLKSKKINYDVYLHTYNLNSLTNPRSDEYNENLDPNEYKLLNPDYYLITDQSEFKNKIDINQYLWRGDPWDEDHHTSLYNLLCQLNSLKLVNELCNKTKMYKCYLYLRPDLKYIDSISFPAIYDIIDNFNQKIIYSPKWGLWGGLNDRFCIGTKSAIDIIANRLDNIKAFSKQASPHSEKYLKHVAVLNNINTKFLKTRAIRVRSNGKEDQQDLELFTHT
jgi:hypothetical protein